MKEANTEYSTPWTSSCCCVLPRNCTVHGKLWPDLICEVDKQDTLVQLLSAPHVTWILGMMINTLTLLNFPHPWFFQLVAIFLKYCSVKLRSFWSSGCHFSKCWQIWERKWLEKRTGRKYSLCYCINKPEWHISLTHFAYNLYFSFSSPRPES